MADTVLELKHIKKSFNDITVLNDINVSLQKGKTYALIGNNGAGKSTIVKILAGIYQADAGQIYYNNELMNIKNPSDSLNIGLGFVQQELGLFDNLTIAENIFFNNAPDERFGIIKRKKAITLASKMCRDIRLKVNVKQKLRELGTGEKHIVAFLRVLARDPNVMIIDELSSALTHEESKEIFRLINEFKNKGRPVLFVTHNMSEILSEVDNVIILRDGEVVANEDAKNLRDNDIVKSMLGNRDVRNKYPKLIAQKGDEILRLEGVSLPGWIEGISFVLKRGEVLGITGLVGSGRSTLAKTIFGLYPNYKGSIFVKKKRLRIKNPKMAVQYGISMLPDDRISEAIFNVSDLKLNITVPHLSSIENANIRWMLDRREEKRIVREYLDRLGVSYFSLNQQMKYLSSGNQQKVLIARWLLANTDIIIMDEPTKDLDIASKVEVYNLMNEMVREGKAIIFISSDFSEIIGMSDRIILLSQGKIALAMDRKDVTKNIILKNVLVD